jgi:hypothetical protein
MPRKIIGTLTLSNLNSMYTLTHFIIFYKSYSAATPQYSKPLPLLNYVCVVALTPNLQVVLFYSIIELLKNSSMI